MHDHNVMPRRKLSSDWLNTHVAKQGFARSFSILDSGDPARPGRPAKTGNILDYEPKLRTHHAGWAD